ncbi:MAG: hypothetical protein GC191_15820 [Azospirillum sp.]|nr:hypothetical protein [Azospirillum sp.]
MASPRITFEVHRAKGSQWVLEDRFTTKEQAIVFGAQLLKNPACEGYRVIRDRIRPDGDHDESEVHVQYQPASQKPLSIAPIDDAPLCEESADLFKSNARSTVTRLLRGYLDQAILTPTELLHNYQELKRLLDKDNLVPSAVARVATLQTGAADGTAGTAKERRDRLYEMINEVAERARKAAALRDLPNPRELGLSGAQERLRRSVPEDDIGYFSMVALSKELVGLRNWFAKLDCLLDLAQGEQPGNGAFDLLDGVVADVVGAPSVLQDLLGEQPSLAHALCCLVDLCRGGFTAKVALPDSPVIRLNQEIAARGLVNTVSVLLDLLCRQLKSAQPLVREGGSITEEAAFNHVLAHLSTPDGIIGGPAVAEALVMRFGRFIEAGGATGRRQSIKGVVGCYQDVKRQIRYLLALASSDMAREHGPEIIEHLNKITLHANATTFFGGGDTVRNNLMEASRLYRQITESPLEPGLRARIADRIDEFLADYILRHRIVERLDNPSDHLRHRAIRLIQLCAPAVVASPKSLDMVRRRVVAHLRQPDFEVKLVDDVTDPAARAEKLRDFFALLTKAGFR